MGIHNDVSSVMAAKNSTGVFRVNSHATASLADKGVPSTIVAQEIRPWKEN